MNYETDRWGMFDCPRCGAPCHESWDECGSCDRPFGSEGQAVGHAKQTADDPMEVWDVIDLAIDDLAEQDGDHPDRYPAEVEVTISVEEGSQ